MKPIVRIEVWDDPVPWSVPNVSQGIAKGGRRYRRVVKNVRLDQWQQSVRDAAKEAMGVMSYVMGPVKLQIAFFREADPKKGQLPGTVWFTPVSTDGEGDDHKLGRDPDLTNLEKAFEDGLEGVVFFNDVQVVAKETGRFYGPASGVVCTVYALDPSDYPPSEEEQDSDAEPQDQGE